MLFGSSVNGFGSIHSDLDISMKLTGSSGVCVVYMPVVYMPVSMVTVFCIISGVETESHKYLLMTVILESIKNPGNPDF